MLVIKQMIVANVARQQRVILLLHSRDKVEQSVVTLCRRRYKHTPLTSVAIASDLHCTCGVYTHAC